MEKPLIQMNNNKFISCKEFKHKNVNIKKEKSMKDRPGTWET